jgi:hypothetical protein
MAYSAEHWDDLIDEIMDNFDFERVHQCMTALDWTWHDSDGVPDKATLRRSARRLLRGCVARGGGGSGGFQTHIDREEGSLSLSFVVEEWDAYKEDEE